MTERSETVAGPGKNPAQPDWLSAWHVNPSLNKDYDFLDGLRGIAILSVVACHFIYLNSQSNGVLKMIEQTFAAGASGVTVFFALSGFLIAHPFWRRKIQKAPQAVPPGYAARRFWKVYPPLALCVVLLTPIYILKTGDPGLLLTAVQWLTGWAWIRPVDGTLNPAMWSLIVEVHFYTVLPLLFVGLRRLSAKATLWIIFWILLVVPTAFRWWYVSHGIRYGVHPTINVNFPSLLDSFAFGVLIAGLENMGRLKKSWARFGNLGVLAYFALWPGYAWLNLHPISSPEIQNEVFKSAVKLCAALMLCHVADPQAGRTRWLGTKWLRWLGLISYEWYLFHQPLYYWIRDAAGAARGNLVNFVLVAAAAAAASLIVAALVYRCYSLPILKRGRRKHQPG